MKPHLEAVLTIKRTLPLYSERGVGSPFSVREWVVSMTVLKLCVCEHEGSIVCKNGMR